MKIITVILWWLLSPCSPFYIMGYPSWICSLFSCPLVPTVSLLVCFGGAGALWCCRTTCFEIQGQRTPVSAAPGVVRGQALAEGSGCVSPQWDTPDLLFHPWAGRQEHWPCWAQGSWKSTHQLLGWAQHWAWLICWSRTKEVTLHPPALQKYQP